MRPVILFVSCCLCAALPQVAWGDGVAAKTRIKAQRGGDFNPASTAWNGLSILMAEARRQGLRVRTPLRWNWRQARINVPLLLIAPRDEELSIKPLKRYLSAGGRVFLADDFGSGNRIWEAFGLEDFRLSVDPDTWKRQRSIDIHRTYPQTFREADFLLRQSSFLFLNVPQWLIRTKGTPSVLLHSLPYRSNRPDRSMGGKVLWRIKHGRGKLIVLSDPSALINEMISFGDNHRFVSNLLRYMTLPTRAKEIVLLWGESEWQGTYKSDPPRGAALSVAWWDALTSLNSLLTPLPALYKAYPPLWEQRQASSASSLKSPSTAFASRQIQLHQKYLGNGVLLFFMLMIGLFGVWMRFASFWSTPTRAFPSNEELLEIPNRFDEQLESYQDGALSYLGPLILLKEELIIFLSQALDLRINEKIRDHAPAELGLVFLDQLEARLQRGELPAGFKSVYPQIERLILHVPGRHQWGSLAQRSVDAKALKVYFNTAMLCLRTLGLEEEFRASRWQSRPTQNPKA